MTIRPRQPDRLGAVHYRQSSRDHDPGQWRARAIQSAAGMVAEIGLLAAAGVSITDGDRLAIAAHGCSDGIELFADCTQPLVYFPDLELPDGLRADILAHQPCYPSQEKLAAFIWAETARLLSRHWGAVYAVAARLYADPSTLTGAEAFARAAAAPAREVSIPDAWWLPEYAPTTWYHRHLVDQLRDQIQDSSPPDISWRWDLPPGLGAYVEDRASGCGVRMRVNEHGGWTYSVHYRDRLVHALGSTARNVQLPDLDWPALRRLCAELDAQEKCRDVRV
ncbi:hypothetical protein [Amycolatopsis sp. NPDC059020]|uniref:hypothetical protein n=1 Tax=unclassified Amycolatopsis TaxID=2618356 RepID=UPI00366FD41C